MHNFKKIKEIFGVIGVLIGVLVISACQPTPEEEIIIPKDGSVLESKINADAALPYGYDRIIDSDDTDGWKEDFTVDNMHCYIDADIVLPDSEYLPVHVIGQGEFDLEEINDTLSFFIKDAKGVREPYMTKEYLTYQLIAAKRGHTEYDYENDKVYYVPYEGQEDDIANLTEQIANAQPEVFEDDNFEIDEILQEKVYKIDNDKRRYVHVEENGIRVIEFHSECTILQLQSWIEEDASASEPYGFVVQPEIEESVAIKQAQELLVQMGLEGVEVAYTEKARVANIYTMETISQGWMVIGQHNYGGAVAVDLIGMRTTGLLNFAQTEYNERWRPEAISIYVDGNGVREFHWEDPVDIMKTVNTNVEILHFNEIKESIRKAVRFGYSDTQLGDAKDTETVMQIDKITLTNIAIPLKDNWKYDLLIPAWLVTYNYQIGEVEGLECVFAINAIDGSIIDLEIRTGW